MPRSKKKAELADTVREFTPDKYDQSTPASDQPDTSFDVATLERQPTSAEVLGEVAEHYSMPPDAPTTTHAERVTRREPVVQSGLTFHRSDAVAGVKQGEGFRLVGNFKVREAVISFAEKPSREVITAMHDAGFAWKPADKLWTYTIGHQTAAQDRLHAERTFEQVAGMVRQERGITHEFGG